MLFLVIVVIALGWAAFAFSWSRDRLNAKAGFGLPPSPYAVHSSPMSAPRTASTARMRRQQVLSALIVAAVLTFFMARLWSVLWGLHIIVDLALVAFAAALYARSLNPGVFEAQTEASHGVSQPSRSIPQTAGPVATPLVGSTSFARPSVLSSSPRSSLPTVDEPSAIQMPESRFGGSGRFAPVLEDERTAVRPGPAR